MLDKMKNKILRKQNKALKIAKKDYDIDEVGCGESRFLLICNAGLMTGVSRLEFRCLNMIQCTETRRRLGHDSVLQKIFLFKCYCRPSML